MCGVVGGRARACTTRFSPSLTTSTAVAFPPHSAPALRHSAAAAAPPTHAAPMRPPFAASAITADPPSSRLFPAETAFSFFAKAFTAAFPSAKPPAAAAAAGASPAPPPAAAPADAPCSVAKTTHSLGSVFGSLSRAPGATDRAALAVGERLHTGTFSWPAAVSFGTLPNLEASSAAAITLRSEVAGRCCGAEAWRAAGGENEMETHVSTGFWEGLFSRLQISKYLSRRLWHLSPTNEMLKRRQGH